MNNKYSDILKLARIQMAVTIVFIFFKFIRPPVLQSNSPEIFKIVLLSLPNFFEAIIGVLTVTGIGLVINGQLNKKYAMTANYIYILTAVLAGIYVIFQELNIIKIRTNTTMDPNDIIFSIIGLIVGCLFIQHIKPQFPGIRMDVQ